MNKALFCWIVIFINIALATGAEALCDVEAQVAVVRSDAKAVSLSNPVEESIPARTHLPPRSPNQNPTNGNDLQL